jgi:hypothetical protein
MKPHRLVDLHPTPVPVKEQPIERPRRSSGSSVKDLVKGLEEFQAAQREAARNLELRRVGSTQSLRARTGGKPAWRF